MLIKKILFTIIFTMGFVELAYNADKSFIDSLDDEDCFLCLGNLQEAPIIPTTFAQDNVAHNSHCNSKSQQLPSDDSLVDLEEASVDSEENTIIALNCSNDTTPHKFHTHCLLAHINFLFMKSSHELQKAECPKCQRIFPFNTYGITFFNGRFYHFN